jgi:hypothetical protein
MGSESVLKHRIYDISKVTEVSALRHQIKRIPIICSNPKSGYIEALKKRSKSYGLGRALFSIDAIFCLCVERRYCMSSGGMESAHKRPALFEEFGDLRVIQSDFEKPAHQFLIGECSVLARSSDRR